MDNDSTLLDVSPGPYQVVVPNTGRLYEVRTVTDGTGELICRHIRRNEDARLLAESFSMLRALQTLLTEQHDNSTPGFVLAAEVMARLRKPKLSRGTRPASETI